MSKNKFQDLFGSSESVLFVALSLLSKDYDNVIPELLYTLKCEDLLKFITVFGGTTIYIPDSSEFGFSLNCAMAAYLYKIQKRNWETIKNTLNLSDEELAKVRPKVKKWLGSMTKDEIGLLNAMKEKHKVFK